LRCLWPKIAILYGKWCASDDNVHVMIVPSTYCRLTLEEIDILIPLLGIDQIAFRNRITPSARLALCYLCYKLAAPSYQVRDQDIFGRSRGYCRGNGRCPTRSCDGRVGQLEGRITGSEHCVTTHRMSILMLSLSRESMSDRAYAYTQSG
jgi:hypothetical protein